MSLHICTVQMVLLLLIVCHTNALYIEVQRGKPCYDGGCTIKYFPIKTAAPYGDKVT